MQPRLAQSLSYHTVLTTWCHLVNTVQKVTSSGRVGTGWLSPYGLGDPADDWLAGDDARCPASRERIGPRIDTSPGKDPRSKSQEGFLLNTYRFHTIVKPKTPYVRPSKPSEVTIYTRRRVAEMHSIILKRQRWSIDGKHPE